jgi:hypothetical protein
MTTRLRVALLGALLTTAVTACRTTKPVIPVDLPPPEPPKPTPAALWGAVQANALAALTEGKVAQADSTLLSFARAHAGTLEAGRALWWRVLMRTDPASGLAGVAQSLAQLDTLLADSLVPEVRSEALMLRRGVAQVDSARRAEVRKSRDATRAMADRQEEVRALRDSMARLTSEIERLRRRLRVP